MMSLAFSRVLMFPLISQPLSLGLAIIASTLFICVIRAITLSSWYGYILFLIYVGGLLVIFAYVAALSPNVLFGRGTPVFFFFLVALSFSLIMYFYPFIDVSSVRFNRDYTNFKFLKLYGVEMVCPEIISILIGLAVVLLINLIAVVKICYYQRGSLRPFRN